MVVNARMMSARPATKEIQMNADDLAASDSELQEIDARLAELVAREAAVSASRRKLHDRLSSFPNDLTAEKELSLSKERRELHAEIDALRARRSAYRQEHGEK
jgi:chromosome segregation ATPase